MEQTEKRYNTFNRLIGKTVRNVETSMNEKYVTLHILLIDDTSIRINNPFEINGVRINGIVGKKVIDAFEQGNFFTFRFQDQSNIEKSYIDLKVNVSDEAYTTNPEAMEVWIANDCIVWQ